MLEFARQYLPILIVGAIIGAFTIAFVLAYIALQKHKEQEDDHERHMADSEIVKRLLHYARPYWKSFVLVFFIMVLSIVYDLVSPLIVGDIQGLIKEDFELHQLYLRVALYAGILVVSLVSTYLQAMILQKTGQKILSQIRLDVFTHIERLSHEQLNNIPVGKLVTRVTNTGEKCHGHCRRSGRDAALKLCADTDGAVLCALCGAVYGDFPQVLPPRPP